MLELFSLLTLRTRSTHLPGVTIPHQTLWANKGSILEGSFKLLMPLDPHRHRLGSGIFFPQEETLTLPQNPRSGSSRGFLGGGGNLIHASLHRREGNKPEMVHFQVCLGFLSYAGLRTQVSRHPDQCSFHYSVTLQGALPGTWLGHRPKGHSLRTYPEFFLTSLEKFS